MARRRAPAAIAADSAGGTLALRDQLLADAGVDRKEQAQITRRVIDKFCQLLSAQKVTRIVVNDGLHSSKVQEYVDDDGALQARAAAELRDTFGLQPSKTQPQQGQSPVSIQIAFVQPPGEGKARVVAQLTDNQ